MTLGDAEPTEPESNAKILVHHQPGGTATVELVQGIAVKGTESVDDNQSAINAAKRRLVTLAKDEYGLIVEEDEEHRQRPVTRARVEGL